MKTRFLLIPLTLLVALTAASPASALYTMVLKNGSRVKLEDFRALGDRIEGQMVGGQPWSSGVGDVDFQSTFMENLDSMQSREVYLAKGKVLVFDRLELRELTATLTLSDKSTVTVPITALDFQNTVIENRALKSGKTPRPRSSAPKTVVSRPPMSDTPGPGAERAGAVTRRGASGRSRLADLERDDGENRDEGVNEDPDVPRPEAIAGDFVQAEPPAGRRAPDGDDQVEPPHNPFDQTADDDDDGQAFVSPRRITRAEVIQKTPPVYDPQLVPEGRGLTALLEVTVTAAGSVGGVKVIKSTGNPALDQAGVEAVNQWVYNPAEKDGVPFETRRLERIGFRRQ